MAATDAKRLRDLLVDFYLEHDPKKLQEGIDINGIVVWTGRNGIDALNQTLMAQTGHTLNLDKVLGDAKMQAARISAVFNPAKKTTMNQQQKERELYSRLHYFLMNNDPKKFSTIQKLHKFALYNGEDSLNQKLIKKYGKGLPDEVPGMKEIIEKQRQGGANVTVTQNSIEAITQMMKSSTDINQAEKIKRERRSKRGPTGPVSFNQMGMTMNFASMRPPPPPLPGKNKPNNEIKALPPVPMGQQPLPDAEEWSDTGTVADADYDENRALQELTEFFKKVDPDALGGLDEYVDLYAEQGRENLNRRLDQIFGCNLDNADGYEDDFLPKVDQSQAPMVPPKSSVSRAAPPLPKKSKEMPPLPPKNKEMPPLPVKKKNSVPALPKKKSHLEMPKEGPNKFSPIPPLPPDETSFNALSPFPATNEERFESPSKVLPKKIKKTSISPLPPQKTFNEPTEAQWVVGKIVESPSKNSRFNPSNAPVPSPFMEKRSNAPLFVEPIEKETFISEKKFSFNQPTFNNFSGGEVKQTSGKSKFQKSVLSRPAPEPKEELFQNDDEEEEATDGACSNYKLDMTGKSFGICVCGFPRADHSRSRIKAPGSQNMLKNTSFNKTNTVASAASRFQGSSVPSVPNFGQYQLKKTETVKSSTTGGFTFGTAMGKTDTVKSANTGGFNFGSSSKSFNSNTATSAPPKTFTSSLKPRNTSKNIPQTPKSSVDLLLEQMAANANFVNAKKMI